jgi:hypothetical protein
MRRAAVQPPRRLSVSLGHAQVVRGPGSVSSRRPPVSMITVVSKHLRVLREAGVVLARVDGPRRIYRLSPQPLNEVAAWLEPYRQMWIESLDALDRHLNTTLSQKLENQEEAP